MKALSRKDITLDEVLALVEDMLGDSVIVELCFKRLKRLAGTLLEKHDMSSFHIAMSLLRVCEDIDLIKDFID